jgi:hypothetical protein
MLCLGMHSNVMLRFMVQAFQNPPLCSSTVDTVLSVVATGDPEVPHRGGEDDLLIVLHLLKDGRAVPHQSLHLPRAGHLHPAHHVVVPLLVRLGEGPVPLLVFFIICGIFHAPCTITTASLLTLPPSVPPSPPLPS